MGNLNYIWVFLVTGVLFVLISFFISSLLRLQRPDKVKLSTYECGEEPVGDAWIQYNVRYYLFAIIFVIFDVEVLFLFPWALVFKELGVFAFVEMFIFIAILLIALIYAWRKGVLKWV